MSEAKRIRAPFWAGWLAFMAAPALLALLAMAAYIYDTSMPVVVDFRISEQTVANGQVEIKGTLNKVRDCDLEELMARTEHQDVTRVVDVQHHPVRFSRPVGPQRFGPWIVQAQPGDGVTLYARERCNHLWHITAELGSFVVGEDE